MSHARSLRLLGIASVVVIACGLAMTLSLAAPMAPVLAFFADLAFLPLDGAPNVKEPATRLMTAISGGVLVGWGVTCRLALARLSEGDRAIGRRVLLPGVAAWFAVDGLGSVLAGAPFNVVLNLVFLAMFAVPALAGPREAAGRPA
jgi:hypothetical protein